MHFAKGAMLRPLFETTGNMLQAVSGCSHNACRFCAEFKGVPYCVSPREEVAADIDEMARGWYNPQRLFLTGGNAFGLPMDDLRFVLGLVREKMPRLGSVGCFARIGDVALKTDAELAELAGLGVDDVSIGAETGYGPALAYMCKGHTAADIVEQCARLDAAGIGYSLFYLAGIAGAGRWEDAARATVEVYGQTRPRRIMIHTLTLFEGAPLRNDVARGSFEPSSEMDILRELRLLNAELAIETFMLGAHYGNAVPYNAWLPDDRDKVLDLFDRCLATATEEQLRAFRANIRSM